MFGVGFGFMYSLEFALSGFLLAFDAFELSRERVYSTFLTKAHLRDMLGVKLVTTNVKPHLAENHRYAPSTL